MMTAQVLANIREILHKQGRKQKYLGEQLGMTEKATSELLNGTRVMRLDDLATIAEALDVTPNDLFGIRQEESHAKH